MTTDIEAIAACGARIAEMEADKETADRCIKHLSLDNERMEAAHRYPHMCRDSHPEIGHATDAERCPVCIERDAREQAEAERDALRDVYRALVGKDWNWDSRPREEDG